MRNFKSCTSGYNPRKINSASKLNSCVQGEKSKVILALPTNSSNMETFEKALMGGFSSVKTRLPFDTKSLMPNYTQLEYDKIKIDKSFQAHKRNDLKVIYKVRFDSETAYEPRRVISKVIKLDEHNQYGYAMTKPMPTGCIKEDPSSCSLLKFNLLLETVDLDDPIGHLFVVDIEFDEGNATKQQVLFNEIMQLIIEKQKILEANECSVYRLLDLIKKNISNNALRYEGNKNLHPLYF